MIRARLVNGPFHGHVDRVTRAPEWVTVDPACACCNAPHLVEISGDTPDGRPAYQLHFADGFTAEYRHVDGPTDTELEQLLAYERVPGHVDVDELATLQSG